MIRCDWGLAGLVAHRAHVAATVIVDVLSFSTAVDVATAAGAGVIPFAWGDRDAAAAEAARRRARLALPRGAAGGQLSLSPASLKAAAPGDLILLPSPNGSRLTVEAGAGLVFAACLRNAAAVAAAVRAEVAAGDLAVIAAGELWPDGGLRPAIEDLLGAGAVIAALGGSMTPEAEVARQAYEAVGGRLADVIRDCVSGQELIGRGYAQDVEIAVEVGASKAAPRLRDGVYRTG